MSRGMNYEKRARQERVTRASAETLEEKRAARAAHGRELTGADRDPDAPATWNQIRLMIRLQTETGVTRPGGSTRREASAWIRERLAEIKAKEDQS